MCLQAERQRRDVEKDHVLDVAAQNAALHRRADGDDFIGIDVPVRLFSEYVLHRLDDARHARLPADEDHFVDLIRPQARRFERVVDRIDRLLNEVLDHALEFVTKQHFVEMLRAG